MSNKPVRSYNQAIIQLHKAREEYKYYPSETNHIKLTSAEHREQYYLRMLKEHFISMA